MIPDAQARRGHAGLSPARARLCALFSHMMEEQIEGVAARRGAVGERSPRPGGHRRPGATGGCDR
jgi:hypothetical protein